MEIISLIIGLIIVSILCILIYFEFTSLLINYYSKKRFEQKIWLLNLGLILIFAIIIAVLIYFDSQLKQSFISQNIWIYPLIIIICILTIIGLNVFIEKKMSD